MIIYIWGSLIMSINYYGERTILVDLVRMIKLPRIGILNNTNGKSLVPYSMHRWQTLIFMRKVAFTCAQARGGFKIMKPCDFMMRVDYFLRFSFSIISLNFPCFQVFSYTKRISLQTKDLVIKLNERMGASDYIN